MARLATSSGSWSAAILARARFEPVRVARQLDARRVGEVFALAADGQLDERGEDRRDDGKDQRRPRT